MQSSEFIIQRISETIEDLAPVTWINYFFTAIAGVAALFLFFPNFDNVAKSLIALTLIVSLGVVLGYLTPNLNNRIAVLRNIQTEVFIHRDKVDLLITSEVRKMLEILHEIGAPKKRGKNYLKQLENDTLKIIVSEEGKLLVP